LEYISETNEIVIRKGEYIRLDMGFYKYIGKVSKLKDVPMTNCLYTLDGLLFIRRVDLNALQRKKTLNAPKRKVDTSDKLDLEVKPGDDATLVIVKELLQGFTKDAFKKLFDNDSDMNNMRRAITESPNGQLSLNRFKVILDKLGLRYKILVYADEEKTNNDLLNKIEKINKEAVSDIVDLEDRL